MALDAVVIDPVVLRVGENATVRITVKKLGEDFEDLDDDRYTVLVRARQRGADEYAHEVEAAKVGVDAPAAADAALPAWEAEDEGKTYDFLIVLVDEDAATVGATTPSESYEEVLGSFTRTIQRGLVGP